MSVILSILTVFVLGYGLIRKEPVFALFGQGVKEGLQVCLQIFPTLMLMLCSLSVFRASGGLDLFVGWLTPLCQILSLPPEILPLALLRPLSGGGSLSICQTLFATYGPDSFLGRVASVLSSSTETTFYTLALYLPGKADKGMAKLLFCALFCDLLTLFLSVFAVKLFF